ncbi:major facilitator superfamily domain-containing protein [Aspergillus karnatakaensis]|uniref:major facilitator superfamily domain-containing protein n=1 Tax=Aspergillus karnatakaensis TaxID=1810916 RepID=UPI003CCCE953
MPLGILEDTKLENVPGTAPLNELGNNNSYTGIDPALLKHDKSGEIVLVPQPSDSPNDPYNWPRLKKELFTITFGWGCGCTGAVGPLLGAAFVPLAEDFGVPLNTFVSGVQGSTIASIAVGSLIFNCLAVKYGKRPVYLITTLGMMVSCFWAAAAKSFASLVAARVVCGLCMGPFEALVPASIADVWFVHERGFRTAIFNLGVLGGINLATPIAGAVIEYGDYQICLYGMGGAFALTLIMVFFWMPETAYARTDALSIDTGHDLTVLEGKTTTKHLEGTDSPVQASSSEEPITYMRELLPYSGYVNHVSFWNTLIRPFYLVASPAVLWAVVLFTTCISWLVLISLTLSQIFSAPPYSFSVGAVGATNVASFVASLIGTIVAGPLVDGVASRLAKINNGIFEPEFRLPIMLTYLLFTATGFFAWGQSLSNLDPWPIPVIVCQGLINLGVQLGTTGVVTYVVDCHREKAGEAFATMNFVKNLFAFGLTFYVNGWIDSQGVRNCFFTIGGITIGVTLLTIPMYIWGKRSRSWVHRHRIAERL